MVQPEIGLCILVISIYLLIGTIAGLGAANAQATTRASSLIALLIFGQALVAWPLLLLFALLRSLMSRGLADSDEDN